MNNTMSNSDRREALSTADIAASADRRQVQRTDAEASPEVNPGKAPVSNQQQEQQEEQLAPLFDQSTSQDFRSRWSTVQQGFVDDPPQAVREGDELVAQVIKSLADTFAKQRAALEDEAGGSTEDLRVALRRYRSFFERLLAI